MTYNRLFVYYIDNENHYIVYDSWFNYLLTSSPVCHLFHCCCRYQVLYEGPAQNYKVTRLAPIPTYQFRICCGNESGKGEWSDLYDFTTTEPLPQAPKGISCVLYNKAFFETDVLKACHREVRLFQLSSFPPFLFWLYYTMSVAHISTKHNNNLWLTLTKL